MKQQLEQFLQTKKDFEEKFKEYLKDDSFPLDERWDMLVKSGLGEEEEAEFEGVDWDRHSYYDDFYMERGSSASIKFLYDKCVDNNLFMEGGEKLFKEDCVKNYISSFKNDW
jgi:sulfur relay (sulfurtransferase) DsrC/TusE family protein